MTVFQLETLIHQCEIVIAEKKKLEFKPGANVKINNQMGTWLVEKIETNTFVARKILPMGKLGLPYRFKYDDVTEISYDSNF